MSRRDSALNGRLVLIVGSRRSGTHLLQRILCTSPFVASVAQETHLFSHGMTPLFERVQHNAVGAAEVGSIYADENVLHDAARDFCDAVFSPHLNPPAAFLVERTPVHAFHLDLIAKVYPDAAVVHIVRDGRDVAWSLLHQPWGPTDLKTAAASWRDSILAARAANHPRYLEIRYEDLFCGVDPALRLFDRMSIPRPEPAAILAELGRVENADPTDPRPAPAKWRSTYSDADLREFDVIAGSLLADLGYESSESGQPITAGQPVGPGHTPDWQVHDIHGDQPTPLLESQHLFEQFLGALVRRDSDALNEMLVQKPRLQAHGYPGISSELNGAGTLLDVLACDAAFGGVQVRGDIIPSFPVFSAVLALRTGEGRVEHRVIYAVISAGRVRGAAVYRAAS
jgi:Sulfotransferase family